VAPESGAGGYWEDPYRSGHSSSQLRISEKILKEETFGPVTGKP
jgi:hypothetical protein